MVDAGEYLEQVGRLDGVVLLNWSEDTLIKQVCTVSLQGHCSEDSE
jgi:hypothetical protein